MAAELLLLAAAEQDLELAFAWYELRQPGLGREFLRSVESRLRSIQRSPEHCGYAERDFRRAIVRRFPYAIFYRFDGTTVTVYSVFHTSQDPEKWRQRLT